MPVSRVQILKPGGLLTIHQRLASAFVALSVIHLAFRPEAWTSAVFILCGVIAYGFLVVIERKEDVKIVAIEKKIQELNSKIQDITLARGMGR